MLREEAYVAERLERRLEGSEILGWYKEDFAPRSRLRPLREAACAKRR